jgi:ketohexokinase
VLLSSRAYVQQLGYRDPTRFLSDQWRSTTAEVLFLPWGADGAYGQERGAPVCFEPALRPRRVLDTLGAGDVFNAAVIDGLLSGLETHSLLARANRFAGFKCGRRGLRGLVAAARREGLV